MRGRIGPEEGDDKSIRILNRVVEWTEGGIKYEADQRHAEIIIRELGLNGESNSVGTPGERDTRLNPEDAGELLGREEARRYRG